MPWSALLLSVKPKPSLRLIVPLKLRLGTGSTGCRRGVGGGCGYCGGCGRGEFRNSSYNVAHHIRIHQRSNVTVPARGTAASPATNALLNGVETPRFSCTAAFPKISTTTVVMAGFICDQFWQSSKKSRFFFSDAAATTHRFLFHPDVKKTLKKISTQNLDSHGNSRVYRFHFCCCWIIWLFD